MRVVTFKVSDDLLDRIDRAARELGVTRSYIIRTAVKLFLGERRGENRKITLIKVRKVRL